MSFETKCHQASFKDSKMAEIVRKLKTKKRNGKYMEKKKEKLYEYYLEEDWSSWASNFLAKEGPRLVKYHK